MPLANRILQALDDRLETAARSFAPRARDELSHLLSSYNDVGTWMSALRGVRAPNGIQERYLRAFWEEQTGDTPSIETLIQTIGDAAIRYSLQLINDPAHDTQAKIKLTKQHDIATANIQTLRDIFDELAPYGQRIAGLGDLIEIVATAMNDIETMLTARQAVTQHDIPMTIEDDADATIEVETEQLIQNAYRVA